MCEFISQSSTYASRRSPLSLFWGTREGFLWIAFRPTLRKKISSVQNVKEAFWETSLWSGNSRTGLQLSPQEAVSWHSFRGICKVNFGSPKGPMVKKEISSDNKYREVFWETAFWCVTSSHRVAPFPSWTSFLTLLSWILESGVWDLKEGNGEKGNILRSKLERSLLSNCIVMCDCTSQSYTFLFSHQFANAVFWKSAKGYFLAQWSLRWHRKYPQMKCWKKLS